MNITDTVSPEATGDRLEMIFNRQKELHDKYKGIEEENQCGWGILQGKPFNLEQAQSQAYVKDLCWRVTEEIAEANEAHSHIENVHAKEEMADALHFLVELLLVVGIPPTSIPNWRDTSVDMLLSLTIAADAAYMGFGEECFTTITYLGLACNCLKNKPWKQTQMQTDVKKFEGNLINATRSFFRACAAIGMDDQVIYDIYFRKSEVNKFRIRSQY
jgi:hypothetical protein